MKSVFFVMVLAWLTSAQAGVIYEQAPGQDGKLLQSSWWDPDGSDYDQYVWDNFMLDADQVINEVSWRGGFDPSRSGSGGPVIDFQVAIYPSIAAGTEPDVINKPIVKFLTEGNANQTPDGTVNGTAMYRYQFTLPEPFQAKAGTNYWVQIEAWQHGIPDWGIAAGTGGDNKYFRRIYAQGDRRYQSVPGDAAFSLVTFVPVELSEFTVD